MQQNITTLQPSKGGTSPLSEGGIDKLWTVEVQIIGTAYTHTWRGFAADSQEARSRGHKDAGHQWPGFGRCVRSVLQVRS